jgi:hypothetical protein
MPQHRVMSGPFRRWAAGGVAAALIALGTGGVASAATITNGNFSNGLTGWTQVNHGYPGGWEQITFTGPTGQLSNGFTVPADPGQSTAAGTSVFGPSDHFLYQDIALEPGMSHVLSLDYRWQNQSGSFYTPNTLSYTTAPNQQSRIDVVKPTAALTSVAPTDILATIVATTTSSPMSVPWTHATVDLSAFAGQTVRLRFADVETQYFQSLDVTNVAIVSHSLNTAPSVSVTGVTDGATYEHGAVPAAGCAVMDAEDGPSAPAATLSATTGPRAAAGLGSQTASCAYTDAGGLTATASATYTIVDTTAPVLTGPGDQTATATSPAGAALTFTPPSALDAVDGAISPSCDHASGDVYPLGLTTVHCSATDAAGNTSNGSFSVTVTYAWSGILQPINGDGSSVFKLGSTVPVKFALTGASTGISAASATLSFAKISNGVDGSVVEATSTSNATTGNAFRYDATSGQYIFNWSTKGMLSGTYRLTINLGDGVSRSIIVSLK